MPPAKKPPTPFVIADALIGAYATNNRINIYLVKNLPEEAWKAKPPGGKGRNIASMVAHMHNVRLMWLKASGATNLPAKVEPATITRQEAIQALEASWKALEDTLRASLAGEGNVKGFKPDAVSFFGYLVAHDAHHRGQITMLARQLGHPVSQSVMFGMWEWGVR
jgi:uncharacterized damage-inducible protein DinB